LLSGALRGSNFNKFLGGAMESKLYVGNLPYKATEDQLKELFAQAGTVQEVAIIKDRETGQSKGFAFVTMSTEEEAQKAINQLNGKSFGNRELKINLARPKEERPRTGGYGGGYGGGGNRSRGSDDDRRW
jgi:cold-inducible RNA-binding protein